MTAVIPEAVVLPLRGTVGQRLLGGQRLRTGNKIAIALLLAVFVLSLVGPVLAPHHPLDPIGKPFSKPGTAGYLLGTDDEGRDILSRMLYGMRTSWWSTLTVIAASVVIGSAVGTAAGAIGGFVDSLLMRITDVFLAMPGTLLAIAVVAAFGPSLRHTLMAVAAVWWPWYARIVRNEVWALSSRPHIDAARLAGVSAFRRGVRHLLPGVFAPLVVLAALDTGALLVTLAGLSFFGLGAQPPQPELGAMSAQGLNYLLDSWWIPVLPAIGVTIMALVAILAGEAFRSMVEERS